MTLNDPADPVAALVSDFARKRVLVLGDAILDEYLMGECSRISPEAPVPVLKVNASRPVLGGAANTAANIVSLGGRASLIALVGHDEGGRTLARCASDAGVDLFPIDHGLATLRKMRVIGQQQQIVRLDYEDIPPAADRSIAAAVQERIETCIDSCDVVVVSDYAKGFVSPAVARAIITRAHEAGRPVIVDPRPQNRACYTGCDYLTPNWKESRALLRLPDVDPSPDVTAETARVLAAELGTHVVLTLGPHGMLFCSRNGEEQFAVPTLAREVFDVSGAGDTVVAAFALARACGADHATAVAIANRAASVVVGKFGTATVTPEEILQDSDAFRLVPRQTLSELARNLRAKQKRIVTINGSFDVLHHGHLHILNEARRRGDVLIVGLNSDASVRSYKGMNRPIIPERQRAEMLLALRMVDYVHIFDEPDPRAFLSALQPDVHVNGSEYGEDCIESETVKRSGGTIHIVNRIPGLSTSRLLDTLQAAATPSDASDQPVAAFRRRTEGGGAPDWQSATTEVPAPLAGRDMDTII
jgi:D-beta-D-heptose 7-phosphate kinase / D-beta-D-heptose 1-phosphate adenosyltransferase